MGLLMQFNGERNVIMLTFKGSTFPDDSNNNSDGRNDSNERGENAQNGDASAPAKGSSPKRIEANRRNALHSTGPKNTERTRHNAVKHGLLAEGLTEWDDAEEYLENLRDFEATYFPFNPVDRFLIKHMALDMVRARRVARMEAENISALSKRPDASGSSASDRNTPMIDPLVMKEYAGPLLDRLQRYDSTIMNRLLRCRRELARKGQDELVPWGTDADIANGNITV